MLVSPARDCPLCPRLQTMRHDLRRRYPDWHNAPVPSFGPTEADLLIVGLAPGLQGANRTGRPFTGDWAGDLLYDTLLRFGFAEGTYDERPDDGLVMVRSRIVNAVRCVPPQNKPIGSEIANCRRFLKSEIDGLAKVRAVVALGRVAHESFLVAMGERPARFKFSPAGQHDVGSIRLFDSYHCSRYNTNTGRLTTEMFHSVFLSVRDYIDSNNNEAA